ncbi:NAD(P)-dependent alcohol dehydrogenase [Leucobacter sp. W1478]|uniref:NAD(P)-dependent alcohol dehydrogenase n=1 Tax=Leucobacter sp. W1478 TaxID=3439065 RepID=UPI003F30C24A
MQAALVRRYGAPDVIKIVDQPIPEPKRGEVVVRVEAVAVTAADGRLRAGRFPRGFGVVAKLGVGFSGPRKQVLGIAYSGVIERVGEDVSEFAPGDEVAGMNGKTLGMHAQYARVPAGRVAPKPAELSHADAAGVLFGGTAALYFLRDRAGVKPGQAVLVNGASGAVGSAAVQLARHFGATVTAVTSAPNVDLMRRIGAESVIDYAATPLADLAARGQRYDVVFDTYGNIDRELGLSLLRPGGTLVLAVADLVDTVRSRGQVVAGVAPERPADFTELMRLVVEGQLDSLTRSLGTLDALVEAHRIVDSGHKVGNLVVLPNAE